MRTINQTIYYPNTSDRFRLWHLTNTHVGAKACDEKLLRQHIQAIADDDSALWIGGGDYIDAICQVGDKRYKPETLAKWALGYTDIIGKQRDYFLDMTAPIADKCIGLVSGNHEWEADKHYGRAIYWEIVTGIAQRKGVAPETLGLGVQGYINLVWRLGKEVLPNGGNHAWKMVVFIHHGFGGGILAGSAALTLQRMLLRHPCDLLFLGHRHIYLPLPIYRVYPGGKTAIGRTTWGMFSQGYLRSYIEPADNGMPIDTYAEQKGLPPNNVGAYPVEITPYTKELTIMAGTSVGGAR